MAASGREARRLSGATVTRAVPLHAGVPGFAISAPLTSRVLILMEARPLEVARRLP